MDSVIKAAGAYYENEDFENNDYRMAYELKVRVPAASFETFLSAAEKAKGEVTSKSINARDVSAEYSDTEIRLNSKKLFRKRYNELHSKAGKVVDMLEIEENIRVLQEEIESKEGQLKLFDGQIAYSTLDITLFQIKEQKVSVMEKKTFGQLVKWNLQNGWEKIIESGLWIIRQWPWILVVFVIFLIFRYYFKRRNANTLVFT